MNYKQALYLVTIRDEGSITAAAKRLYISQPSLSQTLKQLENELETIIFDRTSIPYRLTESGVYCLDLAETILSGHEKLQNQIRQFHNGTQGHILLGISAQRSMQMIPGALPVFYRSYPNVTIELVEAGSASLEKAVIDDKLDVAIAAAEATSPLLRYELIEKETIGILAGSNTDIAKRYAEGTPISLEEVKEEKFISLRTGHSLRLIQETLFHDEGIYPSLILETDTFEVARRVVLTGDFCMFCSDILAGGQETRNGVFLPLKNYENKRNLYACFPVKSAPKPYIERFISICRDVLNGRFSSDNQ